MAFNWKSITLKNIMIVLVGSFFLIQIASVLISTLFPSVPILKGGQAVLLMLLAIAVITLFIIGFKVDELKKKENLIFIIIVFTLVALAYWKLPEYFPQLFEISPQISNSIKQTVGSIMGGFGY